ATHLVIDVTGYYVEPIVAKVSSQGNLDTWSTGVVYAGRSGEGSYVLQAARPIGACAATATPLDSTLQAVAYAQNSYVYVLITDSKTGDSSDATFTVSVVC
ncbi:MAG: hypothetical protein ACTHN0_19610, partial [Aquihabitans sp.]